MVTYEALLFCLYKETRQCFDALAHFCVIPSVGEAERRAGLVFAAVAYHVIEPCSHKAAGNAYNKGKEQVIHHGFHLSRCRGITMVRGSGRNSIV